VRRLLAAPGLAIAASLAFASPAAGHAFYVNDNAPPGGDCIAPETPCPTIGQALAAGDPDPGSPDTVVVSPGTYTENLVLNSDRSLSASGIIAEGSHVIQPSGPGPTLEITSSANVFGFTIGGSSPVVVSGPGRLLTNFFTLGAVPNGGQHVLLAPGADNAVVERNGFEDDGTGTQSGVRSSAAGSPQIIQNALRGFWRGIDVTAGTPVLDRNNVASGATGIRVQGGPVRLTSNLVTGAQNGVVADGVTLIATNLTAFDNMVDISLQDGADIALGSSVVEHPIATSAGSDCAISFSAGPTTAGGSCQRFQQLNTNPGFVNPGAGNYRLAPGSTLIDEGDPAAPQSAFDLNGDPRAARGTCGDPKRRDIGADEFVPDCTDSEPPNTRIRRKKIDGNSVTFRFRSTEPGSEFRCRLDRKPWRPCESPTRYSGLDEGRHVFRVRAIDEADNADSDPASRRFRIR